MLDLPTFVHDMITAVRGWQSNQAGSEPYERNMAYLIRCRRSPRNHRDGNA